MNVDGGEEPSCGVDAEVLVDYVCLPCGRAVSVTRPAVLGPLSVEERVQVQRYFLRRAAEFDGDC